MWYEVKRRHIKVKSWIPSSSLPLVLIQIEVLCGCCTPVDLNLNSMLSYLASIFFSIFFSAQQLTSHTKVLHQLQSLHVTSSVQQIMTSDGIVHPHICQKTNLVNVLYLVLDEYQAVWMLICIHIHIQLLLHWALSPLLDHTSSLKMCVVQHSTKMCCAKCPL